MENEAAMERIKDIQKDSGKHEVLLAEENARLERMLAQVQVGPVNFLLVGILYLGGFEKGLRDRPG